MPSRQSVRSMPGMSPSFLPRAIVRRSACTACHLALHLGKYDVIWSPAHQRSETFGPGWSAASVENRRCYQQDRVRLSFSYRIPSFDQPNPDTRKTVQPKITGEDTEEIETRTVVNVFTFSMSYFAFRGENILAIRIALFPMLSILTSPFVSKSFPAARSFNLHADLRFPRRAAERNAPDRHHHRTLVHPLEPGFGLRDRLDRRAPENRRLRELRARA